MIEDSLFILARLLLLMLSLAVIGEPLRVTIYHFSSLFKHLDMLQILVLNIYLGGFILYVLGMMPFRLFNSAVVWIVLSFSASFVMVKLLGRQPRLPNKCDVFGYVATIALFLTALWIQIVPLTNFIFGSIHDTSVHALFTQVILENGQVSTTLQPYLPEGIIYPQAAQVLFAYVCYVFGYSPPEAVFHVTALFQALSILGAYYLGKALSSKYFSVSLAFVFFCVSRWPRLLTWGSNPYIVAFPLQFISFSLIPLLLTLQGQNESGKKMLKLLVVGILFGYLAALHLTLYVVLAATAFISTLFIVFHERHLHPLRNLLVVLGFSLIPVSLFICRFISWFHYPGHNMGLPSDITVQQFPFVFILDWYLFYEGISPYYPLVIEVIGLIIISGVVLLKMRRQLTGVRNAVEIALCSLAASAILFLLCHLQYVFPSLTIVTGEAARPSISILISFCFCIGIFNVLFYDMLTKGFRKKLMRVFWSTKNAFSNRTVSLLALLVLASMYSPFVYYTVTHDVEYLTEYYGKFSVTTRDDYDLMLWMRDHLPEDVVILVNTDEPGTFIPSVSHLKVIYPFVGSMESQSYKKLTSMITGGLLDAEAFGIMKALNITHVYVGSQATYWWKNDYKWDPQIFLSNPNFRKVKNVSNAYLFKVLWGE